MKPLSASKSFNGRNGVTVRLNREDETGIDGFAVEDDRAGTAVTHLASLLCPCEAQILPDHLGKGPAGLDQKIVTDPVHG